MEFNEDLPLATRLIGLRLNEDGNGIIDKAKNQKMEPQPTSVSVKGEEFIEGLRINISGVEQFDKPVEINDQEARTIEVVILDRVVKEVLKKIKNNIYPDSDISKEFVWNFITINIGYRPDDFVSDPQLRQIVQSMIGETNHGFAVDNNIFLSIKNITSTLSAQRDLTIERLKHRVREVLIHELTHIVQFMTVQGREDYRRYRKRADFVVNKFGGVDNMITTTLMMIGTAMQAMFRKNNNSATEDHGSDVKITRRSLIRSLGIVGTSLLFGKTTDVLLRQQGLDEYLDNPYYYLTSIERSADRQSIEIDLLNKLESIDIYLF